MILFRVKDFNAFVSNYTYDPSVYSRNENFDLELPLCKGEKVYVYGDMDEVLLKTLFFQNKLHHMVQDTFSHVFCIYFVHVFCIYFIHLFSVFILFIKKSLLPFFFL